jgi:hypothetical protein
MRVFDLMSFKPFPVVVRPALLYFVNGQDTVILSDRGGGSTPCLWGFGSFERYKPSRAAGSVAVDGNPRLLLSTGSVTTHQFQFTELVPHAVAESVNDSLPTGG